MPTFYDSQWTEFDKDIDVEEFYNEMSESEREEMVELLFDNGYIKSEIQVEGYGFMAQEFEKSIKKLAVNYTTLSLEEIEMIIKIGNRFI